MKTKMTFGSLFAGIGGFDLGFERSGLECKWQVEKDSTCQKVLSRHWPNVEKFSDVRKCGKHNLARVDVLCGGFPCQDLSVAGRRQGITGKRSGLWFEFIRIIDELKPRFAVIENVPGLLSSNGGKDFAVILRGLVECGYSVAWRIFDAQYDGVAQRRRRVFIVASFRTGAASEILFESESVPWDPPTRRKTRQDIAFTLAASVRGSGDGHGNGWNSNYVARSLLSGARRLNAATETFVAGTVTGAESHNGNSAPIADNYVISMPLLAKGNSSHDESLETYIAFDERNITSWANRSNPQPGDPCHTLHSDPPRLVFQQNQRDEVRDLGDKAGAIASEPEMHNQNFIAWHENKGGQISFDDTAKALRSGASHSYQGIGVRRLSPRECERLQAFPDDFTRFDADGNEIADSARYRMLGNAVCVNTVEWIGKRINAKGV